MYLWVHLTKGQLKGDFCFPVTACNCGARHLQASEGEVPWGSKNEAGRIPVLLCLTGTVGVHYEILPEF